VGLLFRRALLVAAVSSAEPAHTQTLGASDERELARGYKLAADQGDAEAQARLGAFYSQGRGGLPQDDREAARLYKLAADQGNAGAKSALERLGR
jgi:TPR repeat protein